MPQGHGSLGPCTSWLRHGPQPKRGRHEIGRPQPMEALDLTRWQFRITTVGGLSCDHGVLIILHTSAALNVCDQVVHLESNSVELEPSHAAA